MDDSEIFDQARDFFLESREQLATPVWSPGHEYWLNFYFKTSAYAAAVLYSLGKERLLEMEKEGIVHNSTISGGSLSVAMNCINRYLFHDTPPIERPKFSGDEIEQLCRTCDSAKAVLNHTKGNYTSVF